MTHAARSLPLSLRTASLAVLYSGVLLVSLWFAYLLRFDFQPGAYLERFWPIACGVVFVKLALLGAFGQFESALTYFGLPDVRKLFLAMIASAVVVLMVWLWSGIAWAPPRAVILSDFVLSFLGLCTLRTFFRLRREGYFAARGIAPSRLRRIGIIGAGDAGASLIKELTQRRSLGIQPLAIFDDAPDKWGTQIHGVPVIGSPDRLREFTRDAELDEVVIAMPSASTQRLRELVHLLTSLGLKFGTVPSFAQLMDGRHALIQIRPVEIEDLLGRAAIELQSPRVLELLRGQAVLVTGAGGSIGSELCRQIARCQPRKLVLLERNEFALFQLEQELATAEPEIVPLVADVMDEDRLGDIFRTHAPQLVFHAAAHKHVPMMERQPGEAFRNNVLGTQRVADLSVRCGVERFVFISTDKAINPTSVMGATKRLAERLIQARQGAPGNRTRFMAVRFGNVLGSSGSVIPTFKKQIAAGGPVTVTHPEVSRYFMTDREAVGLVLQSATIGTGGEIFVLDMGAPVKIVDLARQLIELSGLRPEIDIKIQFVGLRPGEKLFEELSHDRESVVPTDHAKIRRFISEPPALAAIETQLAQIERVSESGSQLIEALRRAVPEYRPSRSAPPVTLRSTP